MGFIRKITGADKAIKAQEEAAAEQIRIQREAAERQAQAAREAAQAAAQSQVQAIQRQQIADRVAQAEETAAPAELPEVSAARPDTEDSAASRRRKLRAQFGTGYQTGVSI